MSKSKLKTIVLCLVLLVAAVIIAVIVNRTMEKHTYKLEYAQIISAYALQYELDPYFVAAVIHVESGNRAQVKSSAGALGLMQIMPVTGEWIAEKLDMDFKTEDLSEPEINIEYGCWYLRFLFDKFELTDTVAAAYNAGHNRVSEWLENEKYSSDGVSLKQIPYNETRLYIEKIQKAYEKYKKLYPTAF